MARSDEILARLGGLHPQLIDLSLERIVGLLEKLGDPHRRLPPVIHVAGTNGKGSVIAFLRAMLQAAGKRVHVYISPHLVSFHERIQLADESGLTRGVGEDLLCATLEDVEKVNGGDAMTFFEITTAAAFKLFADVPADFVLLEVGLGGRFDATNVIDAPRLTVITPISMDHMDKLGATVALIAREKAGILKQGTVCVVAPQEADALDVIEAHGEAVGAPLVVAGRDFDMYEQAGRMVFQGQDMLLDLPLPALVGRYQILNGGVAVAAALELAEYGIGEAHIEMGLQSAEWPARMQRLKSHVFAAAAGPGAEVWLDGGHNPAGGFAVSRSLADLDERLPRPIYLVVGMMANKDAAGFLAPFSGLVRGLIAVPFADKGAACAAPEELAGLAATLGITAEFAADVMTALRRINDWDGGAKRILICGSLYLAGEVLALEGGL